MRRHRLVIMAALLCCTSERTAPPCNVDALVIDAQQQDAAQTPDASTLPPSCASLGCVDPFQLVDPACALFGVPDVCACPIDGAPQACTWP
ncbi:MAG TPA: hypothetical protein VFO62_10410 [Candidatus Binatia bacterium]|nr:hypothetical protein [Candidatus Binatia bacterium]